MKTYPLLLAALLGLSQCHKKDPEPVDQLPPATQTGANTFGCLVNGQVWTPQGYNGRSNYSVSYDAGLNGGVFDLSVYRYNPGSPDEQSLVLYANQAARAGDYSFRSPQRTRASFEDDKTNCYWSSRDSATTYRRGTLTITRLDLQAGIISGTFSFTLHKPGCDSVRVTNGRFDKKL
ncbi:MAG: DUF6252 family protein [Bacteroidota bacterium]|nr:DUF6252 family protein [Bacteroidota bacterium]